MKKIVIACIIMGAMSLPSMGGTWVAWGNTTDWFTASNWNTPVPTGADDAIINQGLGVTHQPVIDASGAVANRLLIDNANSVLSIAAGGELTTTTQALLGNPAASVGGLLSMDGGTLNVTTDFGVGMDGSASVVLNSGIINANGGWMIAGYGATGTGDITVNGGSLNTVGHIYTGLNGNGTLSVNGGDVYVGGQILAANASAGAVGTVNINGGTTSIQVLGFNGAGTETLNVNGGQLTIRGGLAQDASATFNIGDGELIFTGLTLADVNWGIDNGAGTWNFADTRSVVDTGSGIVVTSIPEPATIGLMGIFGGVLFMRRKLFVR